ncbi:MAG: glutathione S-transferase family protein [Burkholderiaceae bacterium]
MAESLIFYTNPMSRGRIVRWMLEEIGQPYDTQVVEYGESMKSSTYRAVNPMAKVPALKHGGQVVTECAAICAYLADVFAQAGLGPTTSGKAAYYRWMMFAAGPMEAAITNHSLGFNPPPEKSAMVGYGSFEQVMDVMEAAVSQSDYITGAQFSAADIYFGSHIGFGLQFGSIDKRAAFESYWARISDRDAYRRATGLDDALLADQSKQG